MNEIEQLQMRIAELDAALETANPQMPQFLKLIHTELLKAPELVHMLSNEERATIISGLMKQTGVEVIAATKAKRSPAVKVQANLSELL